MKWWVLVCGPLLVVAVPRFDPTAILRGVLIPADAAPGSIIYRLRASDTEFAYPLIFQVDDKTTIVTVDSLNCSRLNSLCNANVILRRRLEVGRFYDFQVSVRSNKGAIATLDCSFRATNATTPINEIFPGAPTLLKVSEAARRNTELGQLQAHGNQFRERPVLLELWGSSLFGLRQRLISEKDSEGTILLVGPLDYETQAVHHIIVLANDPYTEIEKDTRNIASWPLLVAVLDEQDAPPVFTLAPPTTNLNPNLKPGDLVLKVRAEDGDRGNPRDIRYGLVSEGNPFTPFFNLSEDTGELRLAKPLSEILAISHADKPILLTVLAEEIRANPREPPAQSSTVQLALIPPKIKPTSPKFAVEEYVATIDENSAIGTKLDFEKAEIIVQAGVVFSLELLNNNGTFEISPNVANGRTRFEIKVRDSSLLDYESRHSVRCAIAAKQIDDDDDYSIMVPLTVYLNDINDNPPVFLQTEFHGEVPEGSAIGTTVLKVEAYDVEGNSSEHVRYVALEGAGSEFFQINLNSGLITVANSQLDSEQNQFLEFTVKAADEDGKGLTSSSTIKITLLDINDEVPKFDKNPYEFILSPNKRAFTIPAFVKAIDADVTSPNNQVQYELIEPVENLTLNTATGELTVIGMWTKQEVTSLHVRAYDGGVPRLWSETEIRLYPPEGYFRKMLFLVAGNNPNRQETADTLSYLLGQKVRVDEIKPYSGFEKDATDISRGSKEKSVVVATINSPAEFVVDEKRINYVLETHRKEETVREASYGGLWWLFIVLLILILLAILILILCCICEPCPLYVPPRKRKVASAEIKQLVVGAGDGKESKSVQVAEWFGRKEAWTPEVVLLDNEVESLRRHEMERGSERGGAGRKVQRQQGQVSQEAGRDQFYIREGNADILRLITRGGEQQRPVTLVAEHPYIIDSGKDILMRRYIDQQQSEAVRASVLLPNAVHRQSETELLEASLRQQNALLRQILLERERDMRLETQSLPAGTQTDHNAETQTEAMFFKPPKRRARSDNDASEASDEETGTKGRRRRRIHRHRGTSPIRRKIRTPIQEESESNLENSERQQIKAETRYNFGHTKTSLLRKMAAEDSRSKSSRSKSSRSGIRREVLREISDSLRQSARSVQSVQTTRSDESLSESLKGEEYFSEDSLDAFSPRTIKTSSSSRPQRYHSETDLITAAQKETTKKTSSQTDLRTQRRKSKKGSSRYMEWYNKSQNTDAPKRKSTLKTDSKIQRSEEKKVVIQPSKATKKVETQPESQMAKTENIEGASVSGPNHPLVQHSERRFEAYPARRPEEDNDSGIALTRPTMAQKKSVFTIAYADMRTNQLRPESSTSPL